MVTFNLPCKKYTKHYLQNCFGSPAYLRGDSVIGKYFFQLVEKDGSWHDSFLKCNYETECTILIRQDLFLRRGFILSKTGIMHFNTFVEDHFKTQIRILMDAMVEFQGTQIKQAIECVYDKFDLDETIMPQETIRKDYQRYRKDLMQKNN